MKRKLLVVDDIALNRLILSDLFENDFEVIEADNGRTALDMIDLYGSELSIVLLDLVMPIMNGFEVLERMNELGLTQTIPVIMITGENDDEKTLTGYNLGVADLINKPFNPEIVNRRVNNVVALYAHKQDLEDKLREQKEILEKQAARLKQANQFVIDTLSTTIEFRSMETGEHIKRMRTLTRIMLEEASSCNYYPLTEEEIEGITNATAVHDIGKIAIPDMILQKPGPLTNEEFEIMKTHTTRGCEILAKIDYMQDRQYYNYCYEICRHHHERWDGRGYPDKLKGDEISIWAQAAALADVYDALTSVRVYKGAYSHEEAVRMICNGECGAFNPKLLEVFNMSASKLNDEIIAINSGSSASLVMK